jgi:hypothetical protein
MVIYYIETNYNILNKIANKKLSYTLFVSRFPKDLQLQKIWAQKCKIVGTWNPQSYVCSMHFSPDDFVQDLKTELCGDYFFFS